MIAALAGASISTAALVAASGSSAALDSSGDPPPAVVVELFTSQGCSSCPPADRLLSRWAALPDAEVIPLAFHVDYWNRLGWQDPFSTPAWSERQRWYARSLPGGRVYTPQLIVGGRSDCVGSNVGAVEREIAEAQRRLAAEPGGAVVLKGQLAPNGRRVLVEVSAALPADRRSRDLVLALYENGIDTTVKSGENARRELHNDFVVRHLERLARVDNEAPRVTKSVQVELEPEWDASQLGLVAFLQDPERLTISGAARIARVVGGA